MEPQLFEIQRPFLSDARCIHSSVYLNTGDKDGHLQERSGSVNAAEGISDVKKKRKKLKGKRAVVRWLKFFRWKKKKEYERMTPEEKILYKLKKARKKEERLIKALKKIEPKESSETVHDPEILTPEEHFYFLKMGIKCRNYVPIGRRGIYQGVILNMHLHWKKHQTLQVIVKTFSAEEVKEIAAELARLTGGIVLDIQEENTIIMYRGKNYSQPPTEIMSPRSTLSRKKALDKSLHMDALRAVRKFIPRLEHDLELLQAKSETKTHIEGETLVTENDNSDPRSISNSQVENSDRLRALMVDDNKSPKEYDTTTESGLGSDSEDLSEIFETDSDAENERKIERPLYLDVFEKFPAPNGRKKGDLDVQCESKDGDDDLSDFADVDRLFLQAASLLKKKK